MVVLPAGSRIAEITATDTVIGQKGHSLEVSIDKNITHQLNCHSNNYGATSHTKGANTASVQVRPMQGYLIVCMCRLEIGHIIVIQRNHCFGIRFVLSLG